jgi:SAM-dependent methyltransferase
MRREVCGGCGADQLETFLDLGKTPLADRFPVTPDEPEPTFPLELAVCRSCWLVQLLEVVPDDQLFGEDYGFYSGASPSKVAEHEQLAADLLAVYPDQAKRLTVEIGCNDGDLLRHFLYTTGGRIVGVDPAEGPMLQTFAWLLDRYVEPFGRAVAEKVKDTHGQAGLIIARNVAAHVADLDGFFGGIADLLAPDGVAVVEVQYLPDLLLGNQFDHVYHEHRFYFSLRTLSGVCWKHGLQVEEVEHVPAQGGSIRVVLRHGGNRARVHIRGEVGVVAELDTYRSVQARAEYLRARLLDLLDETLQPGVTIAGYGATAKSTTLLNWCGIGRPTLPWIEDTTPAKIGRYSPGMRIPIVEPQGVPPDVWLLLAWNYLPGVLKRERVALEHGTRLLVPIPVPVLL